MVQTSHRCCQPVVLLISPMLMASIDDSKDNNCLVKNGDHYDTLTTLLTTNFIALGVLQTSVSTEE